MTPQQAREILSLSEKELSDLEAQSYIETATLFKDIFFDMLKNGKFPIKK
jgi:hypothetical protein